MTSAAHQGGSAATVEAVEIRYLREAIGAAVLFACGGTATAIGHSLGVWKIPLIAAGFAFGRVLAGLIIPGNRLRVNPASSLVLWIWGRIPAPKFVLCALIQVASMTIVCSVMVATPWVSGDDLLESTSSTARSAVVVALLSACWFVVLATDPSLPVVGGVYAALLLVGLPLGSESLNPARTLAPVIVTGSAAAMWPFLFAPIVAAAGIGLYRRRNGPLLDAAS